jgi:2-amino-4-hydroxy-6-hydroxymethyldihydropteridine diphosphokinase
MSGAVAAFIGLGSNLDDPPAQLRQAFAELAMLPSSALTGRSPLYRSDPIGPPGQPDYVNAVVRLDTELAPEDLLDALQAIEQAHQRRRDVRWGPRTLDLDLLLYGEQCIASERLQVPHPHMHQRAFVLYPLADIAPTLHLPALGNLADLLAACPRQGLERLDGGL